MDADEAARWLEANDVSTIRTETVTLDGMSSGKHLSRKKFIGSLPLGPAVSDLVFSCDPAGVFYMGFSADWRHGFLGDIHQRPDLSTLRMLPQRPGTATCLADHVSVEGEPLVVCPRAALRRIIEQLDERGFQARMAFEVEATLFVESFAEAHEKGYRDLTGIGAPVALAYLNHSAHKQARFMGEVTRRLEVLGIDWEAWNDEMAVGQVELNFAPADPMTAADWTHRTKQIFREVAHDLGHCVTFMAKPNDGWGNGMHVHHSLMREDGEPAFFDSAADDNRSAVMLRWLAGLLATMNGAVSLLTPTITAYRRMVEYSGVPTTPTWGEENKSTGLRLVSRGPRIARIEHRVGSGEHNPYLAAAVILAGGIAGLDEELDLPAPTAGLAWGLPEEEPRLPNTILAAADALEADARLTRLLGSAFTEYWIKTRRWEWLMYTHQGGDPAATSVTDWELRRYFELI